MTEAAESSMSGAEPQRLALHPLVPDARDQIAELTAALAAREHFIAFVSHALRNAMAPVQLLTERVTRLAGDPLISPELSSRAAMLTRTLQRFAATIQWVTEVSDLSRGRLDLELAPIDLVDVVSEVCREIALEAAARGAELVVDGAPTVVGRWDRARIKQLVANLVSNAVRHAGGRIELGVASRDGDAEIVIRDHGPGIDPSVLAQLSDPFHPERSRRVGSLGIGLWIVHTLASAMRGSVTATNCSDGGARFCVVVPRG